MCLNFLAWQFIQRRVNLYFGKLYTEHSTFERLIAPHSDPISLFTAPLSAANFWHTGTEVGERAT